MAIRAVLFDWDGTLARDTVLAPDAAFAVAAAALPDHGLSVSGTDLAEAFRSALPAYEPGVTLAAVDGWDVFARALASVSAEGPDELADVVLEAFSTVALGGYELFDDARAILASLRYRGYRVAVVSNSIFRGETLARQAPRLGIAGYVDAFVSSVDAGFGKPHAAPYELAVRLCGVTCSEALFVGDRLDTDIAGALALGMHAALIDREGSPRQAGAVTVIDSLAALQRILGEGPAPGPE